MRRGAKPRKPKVEAKPPVVRKSLKNESARVRDLEKRLAEALERENATGELLQEKNRTLIEALDQQTATSEILRVISSSPTDVQPTFETIARSARRLCEAAHGMVFRFDGELIHLTAHDNLEPEELESVRGVFPIRPGRESVTARAILTRSLVHVRDRSEDPEVEYGILSANFPTTLSVPLLRGGVPLVAEVWGIPIAVHPSWLVVFALVAWSLAGGYFPIAYPGWDAVTYWAVGTVTALLAFGSVLVHELGHSWVARRNGLPIRSITLFVFGGIAQIGREPAAPAAELRIAVAGPLTSFALAALFTGVRLLAGEVEIVAAPAVWLARINATVALFNLLPGFPLDGGRVLRAIVWRRTGSFDRATRAAALTGRVFATGFIVFGLLAMLRGNIVGGVWIALIGWFLENAARQSGAQVSTAALLRGVSVGQVMTDECPKVPGGLSLERLVQDEVLAGGRRCFFVVDADRLRGLLTLGDVKAVPRERWSLTSVEQVMTPVAKLRSVAPRDDLLVALRSMDEADIAQLPVIENGALIGAVGREQVLRYIAARAELGV